VSNCTFLNNSSSTSGGGIYCRDYSSSTITNCIITSNSSARGGGLCCRDYSSPKVTNCTFQSNSATTYGGGIACRDYCSPTIANCVIINNTVAAGSFGGGGIHTGGASFPIVVNNTIVGNTAPNGGGIYFVNPSTIITNNIIYDNEATTGVGGGIYYNNTPSLAIDYNDVYANTAPADDDYSGCTGGTGAISDDPLFEDEGAGDYHLDADPPPNFSPCIDAGSNAAVPGWLTTDFEGDPRVFDGNDDGTATVDMGADEYYVAPPPPPSRGAVGGTVYPIDKAALLLPWLGLSIFLILAAGALTLIKRRVR